MKSIFRFIGVYILGLVIFVGFPLLGWGYGDLSGYLSNPARFGFLVIFPILQLLALFYYPRTGREGGKRKEGVRVRKFDLLLIQILSLALMFAAPYSDRHAVAAFNLGDTGRYLGLILVICGFILTQVAEKYLGRQFSVEVTVKEDHRLIQSGPYKYIRHPRYLGILGLFVGFSLVFRSGPGICITVLLASVLIWRIFAEERLLREEFGDEWDKYRTKSWRLIPYLF